MEEEELKNKYDALACSIKVEDITSDELNQNILRRLKDNDPELDKLFICGEDKICDELDFCPTNGKELGWLGYYIGKSTNLQQLHIISSLPPSCNTGIEDFRRGLGRNRSIRKLSFSNNHRLDGQIFHMLDLFFKNTDNLTEMEMTNCILGVECVRHLSLASGECKKSLQKVVFIDNQIIDGGQSMDIIAALQMHPQLKQLHLEGMSIGRNECTTLSTLLRNTTHQLQTLNLYENDIDDVGVESLTHAIGGSNLADLTLSCNPSITTRGWKTLSTLFEMPDSNLEKLSLQHSNIGNEDALIFANALVGNCKLKVLDLYLNGITFEGWTHFSKLLCNTSSVNNTYLSNHTLGDLSVDHLRPRLPANLVSSLALNDTIANEGQIAMTKILRHHYLFNMEPFFQWEFKVLPLMIAWLEKARARTSNFEEKIDRMMLSMTYDFVREFPMLYIEPVTRREIEECSRFEKKLQGDKCQQSQLEEVQQRKTRATMRLL